MSRLDLSRVRSGRKPLWVTIGDGVEVAFLPPEDLPMDCLTRIMEAAVEAEQIGKAHRQGTDTFVRAFKLLETFVRDGLHPEDQKVWHEARVPSVALLRLLPALKEHYSEMDVEAALAAASVTVPQVQQVQQPPAPSAQDLLAQQPQHTGVPSQAASGPSAFGLLPTPPVPQAAPAGQFGQGLAPGEASGWGTSSPGTQHR